MQPVLAPSRPGSAPQSALRARFAVWTAVVLAVLAGPLWSASGLAAVDVVWNLAGVTIMLLLLESTPPGAIRLPLSVSWIIVIAGSFWLLVAHGRPGAVVVFVGLVAAFYAERQSPGADRAGRSPWSVAPYLWHAVLWFQTRPVSSFASLPPAEDAGAQVGYFAVMFAMVVAMMCLKRPGRSFKVTGWAFWLAADAGTVALAMGWPPPP